MSTRRDYRVVEMSFDNKDFEKNAQQSISTIDKLKKALNFDKAADSFNQLESAAKVITFQPVIKSIDEVKKSFEGLHAFTKGIWKNISDDAYRTFKNTWNNTIGQIKSGGSARALNIANAQFKLEGLGIEWEKASKDISAAVDGTAYGFDAAANTASQLATAGIELGESYGGMAHALKAVSGIAAMTNSSYEEIGYIFSQIASAGHLMGQDAMQISTRGINVTATLAKQLNKTTDEIEEMQRKGEISFAMFAEAMNDAFGEQAARANDTFQGAMSNVKSALSRIGEVFYGPFYKAMITPLNKIRETINRIKKLLDDGDDSTRDLKDRLTELLNTVSNIFSFFMEHTDIRFFKSLTDGANKALDKLNDISHGWEKMLGIFGKKKASDEVDELTESIERLSEKEQEAVRAIWIEGKYGNGEARISAMKAAGFDEDEINRVQSALNRLAESGKTWEEFQKDLTVDVAETNKELEEENKLTNNLVSSKIARTIERVGKIFSYIKMTAVNLGKSIVNVGEVIAESFLTVFPFDKIALDVQKLVYNIWNLSSTLVNVTKGNKTIKKVADQIFTSTYNVYRVVKALGSIALTAAKSLFTVLSQNLKQLDISGINLANITDTVATFIEGLADAAKNGDVFTVIFEKVVNVIKKVVEYIKKTPEYLKSAGNKIKNFVIDITKKIEALTGLKLQPFIDKVADLINKFGSILTGKFSLKGGESSNGKPGIVNTAEQVRDGVIGVFDKPAELATKVTDWFNQSFGLAKEKVKAEGFANTINAVKNFKSDFKKLKDNLTIDINADTFLKSIKTAGSLSASVMSLILAFNLNKIVNILKKPSMELKNIVTTVTDIFKSFTGMFKTIGKNIDKVGNAVVWNMRTDVITKVAIAMAVMASSLIAVSLLPLDQLKSGLIAMSVLSMMLGTVLGSTALLPAYDKDKINTNLLGAIGLIGLMGYLVTVLAKYDYEEITKALLAVASLSLLATAMTALLNLSTRLTKDKPTMVQFKNDDSLVGTLLSITALMGVMGGVVLAIAGVTKLLGENGGKIVLESFGITVGLLALAIGGTLALMKVSHKIQIGEVQRSASAVAVLAGAINGFVPVITVFSYINKKWRYGGANGDQYSVLGDSLKDLLICLAGVAGALWLLADSTVGTDLTTTASAMAIIFGAINGLIPIIAVMAYIKQKYPDMSTWENVVAPIGGMVVVIGGILALIASVTVSGDILTTAAAMGLIMLSTIALIPIMITMTKMLEKIPLRKLLGAAIIFGSLVAFVATFVAALGVVDQMFGHGVSIVLVAIAGLFITTGLACMYIMKGIAAIIASIAKAVKVYIDLVTVFSKLDTDDIDKAGDNFYHSVVSFCKNVTRAAPFVAAMIVDLAEVFNSLLKDLTPIGRELISSVNLFFGMLITSLALSTFYALQSMMDALLFEDEDGNSLIYNIVNKVTRIITEIIRGVIEALFEKTGEEVVTGIDEYGNEKKEKLSFVDKLWDYFMQNIMLGADAVGRWSGTIARHLIDAFIEVLNALSTSITGEDQEKISKALENFVSAAFTSYKAYGDTFTKMWMTPLLGVIDDWNKFVGLLLGKLIKFESDFRHNVVESWWAGVSWIRIQWNTFTTNIKTALDTWTTGVLTIIDTFIDDLKNKLTLGASAALGGFAGVFNPDSSEMFNATGLVKSAADGLYNAFKKGSDVGSYSAKYGYIGEWAMKSVAMGADNQYTITKKDYESKAGDLATSFTDAVKKGVKNSESGKSLLETLTDTLSGSSGSIKEKLATKIKELFGIDNNSEGLDLASLLNIDTESVLSPTIEPVWNGDDLYSGLNDWNSTLNSYDYGLSTSGDLASSIGSSNYLSGSSITGSSTSEEIAALAQDVHYISEKMARIEVRLDTGALVGGLYAGIDEKLGEQQILAGRGVYA